MTAAGACPSVPAVPQNDAHASEASTLLTAQQLAARWQVPKSHVYRLAREGVVPFVPLGRYRRFRLASIEAFEVAGEGGVG